MNKTQCEAMVDAGSYRIAGRCQKKAVILVKHKRKDGEICICRLCEHHRKVISSKGRIQLAIKRMSLGCQVQLVQDNA